MTTFGSLFIKVFSYAPWRIKLCLNGYEWAKRQPEKRGIGYEALEQWLFVLFAADEVAGDLRLAGARGH